jgi:DNA-binding transcriptional LysR family regulator
MFKDLNDIRLYAAVVQAGAVTKGAAQLGMPAATVSRRLSALEQEIGARLIERSARRFKLTVLGQQYFAAAARLLDDIKAASSDVSALASDLRGPIRVSATAEFAGFFLAEPIASFSQQYPDITILMDLSPRLVNLVDEGFDIAIRIGELQDDRLISRKLMALTRSFFASPKFPKQWPLPQTIDDLERTRLVRFARDTHDSLTVQSIDKPSIKHTLHVRGQLQVNSLALLMQLVIAGAGIGLLPDLLAASALANGSLIRVLPNWQAPLIDAHLLYPNRMMPRRVRLLIEHLQESVAVR